MTFSVSGEEETSFKMCNVTSLAGQDADISLSVLCPQEVESQDVDPSVGSPQGQALQIPVDSPDDADMSFLCPQDKEETVHGGDSSLGIPIAAQENSGISMANQECYFQ